MDWLIANPEAALEACAVHFGITQPWLSTVIHSDIFQAKYQKLLGDYRDQRILPLRDKLIGLAHAGVEKLAAKITTEEDSKVLIEAVRMSTKAIGMGVSGTTVKVDARGGQVLQQFTSVSPEELAAAKKLYDAAAQQLKPPIEGETVALPETHDAPGTS